VAAFSNEVSATIAEDFVIVLPWNAHLALAAADVPGRPPPRRCSPVRGSWRYPGVGHGFCLSDARDLRAWLARFPVDRHEAQPLAHARAQSA
jgi:hypothetical protein